LPRSDIRVKSDSTASPTLDDFLIAARAIAHPRRSGFGVKETGDVQFEPVCFCLLVGRETILLPTRTRQRRQRSVRYRTWSQSTSSSQRGQMASGEPPSSSLESAWTFDLEGKAVPVEATWYGNHIPGYKD
jgi:hypothetical protein